MPTINNATVATGTGLSTAGNGGRKLIRLLSGALISAVRTSTTSWQLHKSLNGGTTWSQLVTITESVNDLTLATKGNDIHVTVSFSTSGIKHYRYNDSGVLQGTAQTVDTGQTAMGAVSTTINDAGTELHAAWSSKNSTYSSSFNIRYAKGTIAADGSVTWSVAEQLTATNTSGSDGGKMMSITLVNGSPVVTFIQTTSTRFYLYARTYQDGTWTFREIYNASTSEQQNLNSLFVPQSINGLVKGRLWIAWHGKDSTDTLKFNIFTSYSDDGGVTWATPTKQTTGNAYDQTSPSLTTDLQGKVLLTWDAQNATTTQTALKVFNGTWGATTTLTGDGYTNVATLFDNTFKLAMTTPPLIRQSTSGVYFSGTYFAGASVSPLSSALGDKTASSVLSYTVTPESGSVVTSIAEKVNGTTVNTYSNPASLSRTFTIPQTNWDALKYYNTHTISVTVTDSNGMVNTQTYTFNKTLASAASLLEAAKAAKDGKDRIGTKREIIAGQVGAPPGSSFDAISAAIDARNVVKRQSGTSTVSGGTISVSTLSFTPKEIIIRSSATQLGVYHAELAINESRNGTTITSTAFTNITSSGFTAIIAGTTVSWEALG